MWRWGIMAWLALAAMASAATGNLRGTNAAAFPPDLASYSDQHLGLWDRLVHRAHAEPLNAVATIIFALAVLHTFLAPKIMHVAHRWRGEHKALLEKRRQAGGHAATADNAAAVSFKAELLHIFGEVEAVFGIWVIPLLVAFIALKDWDAAEEYLSAKVHYTEPMFVVVVMTIAATRPVLLSAEKLMVLAARLGGGSPAASWFAILSIGPALGSFITEPAAMTIAALLLSRKFYDLQPRRAFAYATLGLLFVNVSIGGTLTHFAAPPVLMVASRWDWGTGHMVAHFGWKALLSIVASNTLFYLWFRKDFHTLKSEAAAGATSERVPAWITIVHLLFLGWTVFAAHHPALFIGGFLFFLAFVAATEHHQSAIVLRPALLVGFFLAGLVIHGGLQSWWIGPVLQSLSARPLFFGSVALTAFNDNAAITFLASLVPSLSDAMKYAVVAGAVTGGGLTVIANAPNPAGQAILVKHFPDGVSPLWLFLGALPPTVMAALVFMAFR